MSIKIQKERKKRTPFPLWSSIQEKELYRNSSPQGLFHCGTDLILIHSEAEKIIQFGNGSFCGNVIAADCPGVFSVPACGI